MISLNHTFACIFLLIIEKKNCHKPTRGSARKGPSSSQSGPERVGQPQRVEQSGHSPPDLARLKKSPTHHKKILAYVG
ncbi:hypothetical protein QVD17_15489 [Tagetes erecta]|uniref:Uncharacterized protein n=1 Tax=Tagetes erecta TaxID=13708 RepID=A0AAD8KPB2_TARER|nr:hypothetical protein QVD17_15489 [Tagetes erecta]